MAITPKAVQELREKTGVGMMDCKPALVEAGGDMEEAVKILRKKGIATAEKKSARGLRRSGGILTSPPTAARARYWKSIARRTSWPRTTTSKAWPRMSAPR